MRSRFRMRFMALPMALILALVLLPACSSDGNDDDANTNVGAPVVATQAPTAASKTAPKAAPAPTKAAPVAKKPVTDELIIGALLPSLVSNNIGRGLGPQSQIQLAAMYEYLIGTDPATGALVPQLATEWAIEPNGIDIRVKLRPDIRFHDGSILSWRDIDLTVGELGAEDGEHTHQRNYKTVVIEPVSDLEFIWKLPAPLAEQFRRLSEQVGGMEVMSAADYAASGPPQMNTAPSAGTAAWQYVSRDQQTDIQFERVDYEHWRYNPEFSKLTIRWMNEQSTRLAALITDEIHVTQLGADSTELAEKDGMLVSEGTQQGARIFAAFNGGYVDSGTSSSYEQQNTPCGYVHCDSPWHNALVRKAFNKAIDKDALNEAFLRGAGQKMIIQAIPESSPAFNPEWRQNYDELYGYDPQVAKDLLAEAGYGPNSPLEINVNVANVASFAASADTMESIGAMLADVGVKVKLQSPEAATHRPIQRALKLVNWISLTSSASFDVQSTRVHHADISPRGGGFEPLEINSLIKKLQMTMLPTEQDKLLRQIGDIAHPIHIAMNLFWLPPQIVLNPEYVESWVWPGNVSGLWSHFHNLKVAKK
jgi:peptide/nickel transport system substrate-binding protein